MPQISANQTQAGASIFSSAELNPGTVYISTLIYGDSRYIFKMNKRPDFGIDLK